MKCTWLVLCSQKLRSPTHQLDRTISAGLKRKRGDVGHKAQEETDTVYLVSNSPLQALYTSSAPRGGLDSALPRQSSAAPAGHSVSIDEDDELYVELAFAKKPKPALPHPSANMAMGAAASIRSKFDAAFGSHLANDSSGLVKLSPSRQSLPMDASQAADDDEEVYDVPDFDPKDKSAAK